MTDAGFVIAAYGVILGGIGLYAAFLARRLRIARQELERLDGDVDEAR
jgi:CcmD family protein